MHDESPYCSNLLDLKIREWFQWFEKFSNISSTIAKYLILYLYNKLYNDVFSWIESQMYEHFYDYEISFLENNTSVSQYHNIIERCRKDVLDVNIIYRMSCDSWSIDWKMILHFQKCVKKKE